MAARHERAENCGAADILIAAVDELKGFSEATNAVFRQTVVQTCLVHLIRHSLEFVPRNDRKLVVPALRATSCHQILKPAGQ